MFLTGIEDEDDFGDFNWVFFEEDFISDKDDNVKEIEFRWEIRKMIF